MPHANPDVRKAYQVQYRKANRTHLNELARIWYMNNIDSERRNKRIRVAIDRRFRPFRDTCRRLGIDEEVVKLCFDRQAGLCAICNNPETAKHRNGTVRRLAVDHDHSTGRFRGLLCTRCNKALGVVKDDINLLAKMIAYLAPEDGESQ